MQKIYSEENTYQVTQPLGPMDVRPECWFQAVEPEALTTKSEQSSHGNWTRMWRVAQDDLWLLQYIRFTRNLEHWQKVYHKRQLHGREPFQCRLHPSCPKLEWNNPRIRTPVDTEVLCSREVLERAQCGLEGSCSSILACNPKAEWCWNIQITLMLRQ
jgi:hypothetical protein